ncbi:15975_t:CDS:2 [Entrophospora sp. SA101]|nr:15975_t:CDS:2 [Entrophospora sp. SA101]CAJ0826118.1 6764_t:CDS:2 [Entrophospora sp. SA101]
MSKNKFSIEKISNENLENLKELAIDWSLAHGLAIKSNSSDINNKLIATAIATHAPVSLVPSPFPKELFQTALELQPIFNLLFHRISEDHDFISNVIEDIIKVDDFIKNLYEIYLKVRNEGVKQTVSLGLHRSDYFSHSFPNSNQSKLLQVEFNTISSSFSSLSTLTGQLHSYFDSIDLFKKSDDYLLPENESMDAIPEGIAAAHKIYGVEDHKVHLIRKTLLEIHEEGKLDGKTGTLLIGDKEIAVTYFRAGYGPDHYPTHKEWGARLAIECSRSIKCPTVAYQLVGSKKFQQVLSNPGILERYLSDSSDITKVRSCFAGLYPLDSSPEGESATKLALENPERFVMKPQREGGGNNIYGSDIPLALMNLSKSERSSYILMDLIKPPSIKNIVIRKGGKVIKNVEAAVDVEQEDKIFVNKTAGHLLRTKAKDTKEGGVATGFSVIDSPLLI